jgi:hypothetical protein
MCRLSSAEYDIYRHTNSGLGRSLFGLLRDLWQPRQPRVEEAKVVRFPANTRRRAPTKKPTGGVPKQLEPPPNGVKFTIAFLAGSGTG